MNILITGASGFIGKNLKKYFTECETVKRVFTPSSKELDLTDIHSVRRFFHLRAGQVHAIIHCAGVGGKRLEGTDAYQMQENLIMYNNLISWFESEKNTKYFFNIGSGAEFDKSLDITGRTESWIPPSDHYGLSKKLIADDLKLRNRRYKIEENGKYLVNLRAFGIFGPYEEEQRFIKSICTKAVKNEPITIHKERRMDFFGVEDIGPIIQTYIENEVSGYEDMNLSYPHRMLWLTKIADFVVKTVDSKSPMILESNFISRDYFGSNKKMKAFIDQYSVDLKGQKELLKRMVKNELH